MQGTSPIDLETELRYFNEHRSELLVSEAGRFALVKGEALIGVFASETEAIRHGYQTLGNVSFLVKQITEADIPLSFTSFNLTVDIERETDGRWIGEVTELPGVLVYGNTRDDAVAKAKALAFRVLADRLEHGEGHGLR